MDEWVKKRVGDVVSHVASGPSPTCEERAAHGAEWGLLKTTAVTWSGWDETAHKIPPVEYWGQEVLEVQKDDVIITKAGPRHRVGVVVHVPETRARLMVSGKMVLLRPDKSSVVPRLLADLLATPPAQKFLDVRTSGMAEAQTNFTNKALLQTPIVLPPLEEQRRIAEVIDTIDETIQATEDIIAKLKQQGQGLEVRLLQESQDAQQLPLTEVATVDRGKFTARPRNDPAFYGGKHPFIQTGDVARAQRATGIAYSQTLNELGLAVSRIFDTGTIAVTIAANVADSAILDRPMCFPDSVVGVTVAAPNSTRWVELCIHASKRMLDARAPQSAQKNINLQDLRQLIIPVPIPAVQSALAESWEDHQRSIDQEVLFLAKLKRLRAGLAADLLSGRVRTVAA